MVLSFDLYAKNKAPTRLFDESGAHRYSFPEGDFSLLKGSLEYDVTLYPYVPRFEVDGEAVLTGERLVLDTGESFIFKEVLGAGFYTIVISDIDNKVIRLVREPNRRFIEMHEHFFEAALLLSSAVDPSYVVQLDPKPFSSFYAMKVESLKIEMTLDQYLQDGFNRNDAIYLELLEFFEAFYKVKKLGSDFLPKQIGYARNRGWVLFDLSPGVELSKPGDSPNTPTNLIAHWSMFIDEIGIKIDNLEQLENDLRTRYRANNPYNIAPKRDKTCRALLFQFN